MPCHTSTHLLELDLFPRRQGLRARYLIVEVLLEIELEWRGGHPARKSPVLVTNATKVCQLSPALVTRARCPCYTRNQGVPTQACFTLAT